MEAPVEADPVKFEAEVVLREWGVAVAKSAEAVHFAIQPRCQTWSCKCLALALVTEDSSVTTRWLCRDEEDDVGRFVCVDKYNRMHYANSKKNNNSIACWLMVRCNCSFRTPQSPWSELCRHCARRCPGKLSP